ncbi:apolipoprotein A-V isoform X2 [Alosa sapidissima]|nr:apolipoprotein A-V isoform X2 [Alosa sapidissima]XP_041924238.1 apolipoprotein A-V isoform X2 [Alosa sapidissima]
MYMRLLLLAVSFLTTTALPLQQDHRDASWSFLPQDGNQAREKTELNKGQAGMWKSHVENSDLYSRDPLVGEKPTLISERLRARLRQQLAELRARLWPQSVATPAAVAHIRELLGPLTNQLQAALSANVHDLCAELRQHLQQLQPTAPASGHQGAPDYQALLPQISRSLELSTHRVTSSVLQFRVRSTAAADGMADADERELLLEVASRLAHEASTLETEFRSKVGALQASLGGLSAPAHAERREGARDGDAAASSTALFCQHTRSLIQQLSGDLESQFAKLEQRPVGQEAAPPVLRPEFLREDFTSRLRSLLQEIMQTLN